MEHPYAALFPELCGAAQRTQRNLVVERFEFQLVTWGKPQFFPHRLGKNNPTGFIDSQFCRHRNHYILPFGSKKWYLKMSMTRL